MSLTLTPSAAEDHRPAHGGRPRAGARDDQAAVELLAEDVAGPRADQGQDPGLVAPAQFDEPFQDAGAAAQVLPAADDQQAARWHTHVRVLVHGCVVTQRDIF
jgi:hypothetical protein